MPTFCNTALRERMREREREREERDRVRERERERGRRESESARERVRETDRDRETEKERERERERESERERKRERMMGLKRRRFSSPCICAWPCHLFCGLSSGKKGVWNACNSLLQCRGGRHLLHVFANSQPFHSGNCLAQHITSP
jgi:hypothetical protein